MTISSSNSTWSLVSWPTPRLMRKRKSSPDTMKKFHKHNEEINKRDSQGRSLLFYAARYDQPEVAIQLLGAGCDPNVGDNDGNTPLHQAVYSGSNDVLRVLIKQGECDVNSADNEGYTSLMAAVCNDEIEMVKLLVKAGAKLNEVDQLGRTALMIGLSRGSERSCLYLLKSGCDVTAVDSEGHTALYYATFDTTLTTLDMAKKLFKSGYNAKNDTEWLKQAGESEKCVFQTDMKFYKRVLHKAGIRTVNSDKSDVIKGMKFTCLSKVFQTRVS